MKEKIKTILNKRWELPFFKKLAGTISRFSIAEKIFFYLLCAIFIVSGAMLLEHVNVLNSVNVPAAGGSLTEGIIGNPRFINPVLAVSDTDNDLTELVYSGLMKATPQGTLVPDLAQSYTISPDGLTYTFTLRNNAYFQDGTKVTADDVVFTIDKIQDAAIKSPEQPEFYDVTVQEPDPEHVVFVLNKPYSPFLQNLTIGILPKHLWGNLSDDQFPLSQYNVEPIGSGPYKINSMATVEQDMLLVPTQYDLVPFDKYALGTPFISNLIINFYQDEPSMIAAYNAGEIESMNSVSPDAISTINMQSGAEIKTIPLPRSFAVFFNQSQSPVLADKNVREALNDAVDRQAIINQVLDGYGVPIYGPIPAGLINDIAVPNQSAFTLANAESILQKDGWVKSTSTGFLMKKTGKNQSEELDISIATLNSPDLVQAANIVAGDWQKLGANVTIAQYDFGDLEQNIIRPRKFSALLYGTVTGRDMDFFSFWDSSQRNDPGLNIAMYANSKVDALLEDARANSDMAKRISEYKSFNTLVENDVPAVFLYSPDFIYIVPDKVQNLNLGIVTEPFERFLGIQNWYIDTNNLWKIFLKK